MTETEQAEPVARIRGEPLVALPDDLYIPPDALEVFLEAFEGPLDLLLYLIKRQNLDILDIPVAEITRQYMGYVELMRELRLELAAEYLVMASVLAEIKSRMLLPRPTGGDDDEEGDPRAELIRRLQEYERFQKAAEALERLPQVGRDVFPVGLPADEIEPSRPAPEVELRDLIDALREALARSRMYSHHEIEREALSVRACMSRLLDRLRDGGYHDLRSLLVPAEGRLGVVVTFLALLELAREALVELQQRAPYEPIYVLGAGVDHE